MELAALCDIPITEFWEVTPYELNIVAKGYAKRREYKQKLSIYQAYLVSRWVWQKKVDIRKHLGESKPKRQMTDEEMLERAKALNALFGGEVKVVGSR